MGLTGDDLFRLAVTLWLALAVAATGGFVFGVVFGPITTRTIRRLLKSRRNRKEGGSTVL